MHSEIVKDLFLSYNKKPEYNVESIALYTRKLNDIDENVLARVINGVIEEEPSRFPSWMAIKEAHRAIQTPTYDYEHEPINEEDKVAFRKVINLATLGLEKLVDQTMLYSEYYFKCYSLYKELGKYHVSGKFKHLAKALRKAEDAGKSRFEVRKLITKEWNNVYNV